MLVIGCNKNFRVKRRDEVKNLNIKVSVVMPVYHVTREALKKSVESVINQTYKDWELIIVDDGNEEEYIEDIIPYEQKNKRITIIRQNNSGVSVARNAGVQKAIGEWIIFIDSDDWMEENQIETLLAYAERHNAECVIGNTRIAWGEKVFRNKDMSENEIVVEKEHIQDLLITLSLREYYKVEYGKELYNKIAVPWGRIYKKSIIQENGVAFIPGIHPAEDTLFNLHYWKHCKKVIFINQFLHCYQMSATGVTRNYNSKYLTVILTYLKETEKFWEGNQNLGPCYFNALKSLISLYYFHPANPDTHKKRCYDFMEIMKDKRFHRAVYGKKKDYYSKWDKVLCTVIKCRFYFLLELKALLAPAIKKTLRKF